MSSLWIGVASGLVTVLLAWIAKAVFLNRRLHLVQPKLFDYSGLGSNQNSKTIELTVINAGRRSEEDVTVQFAPGFKYVVVAGTSAGLLVDAEGVLKINRLPPKQEITLILIAEGGEFRKEHVLGITSRDKKGTVKDSLQEAQATPEQAFVALAFIFLFLFPFGYAAGKFIEVEFWPALQKEAASPTVSGPDAREPTKIGFAILQDEMTKSANVPNSIAKARAATVSVGSVTRDGDTLKVQFILKNTSSQRLEYTISLGSPAAHLRAEAEGVFNFIKAGIIVLPGKTVEVSLTDFLPGNVDPQLVLVEARVDHRFDYVWRNFEIELKPADAGDGPALP